MKLTIPSLSLVVLVGASGSGKSTFAKKHFLPTEIISSDDCRGLVSDDVNSMEATGPAFEILHFIAGKRLRFGKLAVIDATNVQPSSRTSLIALAKEHDCLPVAIVFDLAERLCLERNKTRPDRHIPEHAIRNHCRQLRQSIGSLKREGFRYIYILKTPQEVEEAVIERQPLWSDRREDHGPFDIIGDVHGCFNELSALVSQLGYVVSGEERFSITHPEGRKLLFLGDLGDRGPQIVRTFRFVMDSCESGAALCVPGNHDVKLLRKLNGADVQVTHGLDQTLGELLDESPAFTDRLKAFLDGLVSHYVLDGGRLIAAHAGMREEYQGRSSARVREFALYGETTGETDEYGLPVRYDWTRDYRGKALVVYGHTPVGEPFRQNNTVCIDTGCVFGGSLTAYRYPEGETVSVPAMAAYYRPARPFLEKEVPSGPPDDLLDIGDVLGGRVLDTRLMKSIVLREENAMAALETMSRFAADPRWLIYLPPTMSPCETSGLPGILEHPREAFAYYSSRGVGRVVLEKKHMGSRAVVVVCRDESVAAQRFGVADGTIGIVYTRTGRHFFEEDALEAQFLQKVKSQLERTGFFEDFHTGWACLDCELLPWSQKAQSLLQSQYAPAGVAGTQGLAAALAALENAAGRGYEAFEADPHASGQPLDLNALLHIMKAREEAVKKYVDTYRAYCWPVKGLEGIQLAPFHLLATEGQAYADRDHVWHMETISKYCADSGFMIATPYLTVDVTSGDDIEKGVAWWQALTDAGGEGMVVKPFDFAVSGKRGLLQPAVKCRGPEYLRIIYGPEYLLPENLPRLKARSLGRKRALALKEFSLGLEALERFVRREPLCRVHECVFGVLALESEPVDPRL